MKILFVACYVDNSHFIKHMKETLDNNLIVNGHTIFKLDIPGVNDENYKLIDMWFNEHFIHFRAGSCFGVGSNRHRNNDRLTIYQLKYKHFIGLVEQCIRICT